MSLSLTQTKPLPNLRPLLWLLLPLLVLTTLFFWPLSLIVEQALRDANGMAIEGFELPLNLMLACSIRLARTADDALDLLLQRLG